MKVMPPNWTMEDIENRKIFHIYEKELSLNYFMYF